MHKPLVSIVIPCFNREDYLAATLDSCLTQTYQLLEIIVVDDGSTDKTLSIANQYAEQNSLIKVVHTENHGQCAARNFGVSLAQGTYIKFLDSDDLILPQTIESQVQILMDFQADIAICSARAFWTEELEEIRENALASSTISSGERFSYESILDCIKKHHCTFNEVLISKQILLQVGGFEPNLKAAEELNLLLKIATKYPKIRTIFHADQLLLKRLGYNSLAYQVSKQTQVPYLLLSLQKAGEYYLKNEEVEQSDLKHYIFNRLYQTTIFAYRNGLIDYASTALKIWKNSKSPLPSINPWYHQFLHHFLGFEVAELSLSIARNLLKR